MKRAVAIGDLGPSLLALAVATMSCASHAQQVTTPTVRNGGSTSTKADRPAFNPYKYVRKLLHGDRRQPFLREETQRLEQWLKSNVGSGMKCDEAVPTDFGIAVRLAFHCAGEGLFRSPVTIEGRYFYHPGGAVVIGTECMGCGEDADRAALLRSLIARSEGAVLAKLAAPGVEGILPYYDPESVSLVSPMTGSETEWVFEDPEELVQMVAFRHNVEDTRASLMRAPQKP